MPGPDLLDRKAAKKIAKKLKAEIVTARRHDIAVVEIENVVIGKFGLRRDRYASHGHIPDQIFVSLRQAINLANCPMSLEDYVEHLKSTGHLV